MYDIYIYKYTHAHLNRARERASGGRKFRSIRTLYAAVKPVKGSPFGRVYHAHPHERAIYRTSVRARQGEMLGQRSEGDGERGRKRKTRTAIVVEDLCHNLKLAIHFFPFFSLFPFFYEALRKYFVIYERIREDHDSDKYCFLDLPRFYRVFRNSWEISSSRYYRR